MCDDALNVQCHINRKIKYENRYINKKSTHPRFKDYKNNECSAKPVLLLHISNDNDIQFLEFIVTDDSYSPLFTYSCEKWYRLISLLVAIECNTSCCATHSPENVGKSTIVVGQVVFRSQQKGVK